MNNEFREDLPQAAQGESSEAMEIPSEASSHQNLIAHWLESLLQIGAGEALLRVGTTILSLMVIFTIILAMQKFYHNAPVSGQVEGALAAGPTPTPAVEVGTVLTPINSGSVGIARLALIHTNIPSRPRTDIVTYTVQQGDTVSGIADKYGLEPKTVFAANYDILQDDPHNLLPGQELKILPLDGVIWQWTGGIPFGQWAAYFQVKPEDIIDYPPNHLDPNAVGDPQNANIKVGTYLIIPGGYYQYHTPGGLAPGYTRSNPPSSQVAGPGACPPISSGTGAVGLGSFVYPTDRHYLSGFDYSTRTNHLGIDLAANLGDNIYAADGGVVMYAGWNNYGYGNMVMIDHGTGFWSLYAHLSQIWVSCGENVTQGQNIGAAGATGHASGPHLHFEIRTSSSVINPWDVLPPP
jgi:murein DD-endopeptidase MepM/ murein hydrolase activator NlpD